jgi:hypothetical protein
MAGLPGEPFDAGPPGGRPLAGPGAPLAWRAWWAQVSSTVRQRWRAMAWPLLGTILPALPVAACVALAAAARQAQTGQTKGPVILAVVFYGPVALPLAVAGGYLIARCWARAVWAASAPDPAGNTGTGGRSSVLPRPAWRVRRLWLAYLAGMALLFAAAFAVGASSVAAGTLALTGPLGLLGTIMVLAPAAAMETPAAALEKGPEPPGSRRSSARRIAAARLAPVAAVLFACSAAIGFALAHAIGAANIANGNGVDPVTAIAAGILADLLTIAFAVLLAAASAVTHADIAAGG